VIAAARQNESDPGPNKRSDREQQSGIRKSHGIDIQYLHTPSVFPSSVLHAADRLSDVYFFGKLAAGHHLAKLRDLITR
jgi:hypothetical protein